MDSDYDRKFEEMKKYIPFLENMIKRLASSNMPSNPRQAQLDKIRSLRDLLLDKKKRMKMENLIKCEQVLINLYKKVEQKETIQGTQSDSGVKPAQSSDFNEARSKLMTLASKLNQDTLPEIARANEAEEVWDPGSKEPALFQRRPNRISTSPSQSKPLNKSDDTSPQSSKKKYTRVLVSPDRSTKRWSENEGTNPEKPCFSRRSPRRQPRDVSPIYHKEERKKSKKSKDKKSNNLNVTLNVPEETQSNDLNITLKVPDESLSSLSTDNIVSRIINCNDNDVDIATLREIRSQILGELKNTGVKEDISDLLLKSCSNSKNKKDTEIEEGELSDSESEAIESIYGNLVMDKDKTQSTITTSLGKDMSRKIQICLVINSDKVAPTTPSHVELNKTNKLEESDFESFPMDRKCESDEILPTSTLVENNEEMKIENTNFTSVQSNKDSKIIEEAYKAFDIAAKNLHKATPQENEKILVEENQESVIKKPALTFYMPSNEETKDEIPFDKKKEDSTVSEEVTLCCSSEETNLCTENQNVEKEKVTAETITYNDLKMTGSSSSEKTKESINLEESDSKNSLTCLKKSITEVKDCNNKQDTVEIPFLNMEEKEKKEVVSEIDILQALKNEILGESAVALDTEVETPLLHQPKVTKVACAKEIVKKRISIENYKQKSNSSPKPLLFKDKKENTFKEDKNKKQSLKLTEKECERFNFPIKLPFNEISDDESVEKSSFSVGGIYDDLAPKSPDHEDFADTGIKPPVIIPSDPVKPHEVVMTTDVDMRKLSNSCMNSIFALNAVNDPHPDSKHSEKSKVPLLDPRKIRKEDCVNRDSPHRTENLPIQNINHLLHNQVPSNAMGILGMPPNILSSAPNMTPLRAPNMTPTHMTPNARSFEMTPRKHFDSDDNQDKKHVYAPLFPTHAYDKFDTTPEYTPWDSNKDNRPWEENQRNSSGQRDIDYRRFNRDGFQHDPRQDEREYIRPFGRQDCPSTPLPSFGRQECPTTPLPSFGRHECPTTPLPSFGRLECPNTPLASFGRLDCPSTPLPSFGRSEMPMTPVHPFGRSDGSVTPNHSFGRSDYSQNYPLPNNNQYGRNPDPRFKRHSEIDNYKRWEDDRDSRYNKDRQFNSGYKSDHRSFYTSDPYEMYPSRKNKNERQYNDYRYDREGRGRSQNIDHDRNRFSKDNHRSANTEADNFKYSDSRNNNFQRERSITRDKSVDRKCLDPPIRASSVSRSLNKGNQFNVKQSEGRSFTIDTSVNTSFQGFNKDNIDFNSRRQRAASVGRTFSNDICNRNTKNDNESQKQKSEGIERRRGFSRARSVGRETRGKSCENLKDTKADLRSFKLKNDLTVIKSNESSKLNKNNKNKALSTTQNLKNNSSERYSPRKNMRDPRVRRESRFDNHGKNAKSRGRDAKSYGIVYSDDNISKGTILGSGTGVKNYKIPKIKRSPEKVLPCKEAKEKEQKDNIGKDVEPDVSSKAVVQSSRDNHKINNDDSEDNVQETKSDIIIRSLQKISSDFTDENVTKDNKEEIASIASSPNRRVTRSSKISLCVEPLPDSPTRRTKKFKKAVIYDSESDTEDKDALPTLKIDEDKGSEESIQEKKSDTRNKNCDGDLNPSFGDLFSDNIACDPVLDNINALIADLDHELDTSKSMSQNQFTQEILLENMMENITSPESTELDKTKSISNDDLSSQVKSDTPVTKDEQIKVTSDIKTSENLQTNMIEKDKVYTEASVSTCISEKVNETVDKSEAVVSTSKDDMQDDKSQICVESQKLPKDQNDAKLAAPDSTINIANSKEISGHESVPDSTNESSNDITSSVSDVSVKDSLKSSDSADQGDSMCKLLSILQDKSKIKELLSMLEKNSSENEKIKRKLEKLSEIVSDEEENDENETKDKAKNESDTKQESGGNTSDNSSTCPNLKESESETKTLALDGQSITDDKSQPTTDKVSDVGIENKPFSGNNVIGLCTLNEDNKNEKDGENIKDIDNAQKIGDPVEPKIKLKVPKKASKGRNKRKGLKRGPANIKRVTRSGVATKPTEKKPSRELLSLQADIKEMFIKDDILGGTTGIRMCRLAKLVDENTQSTNEDMQKSELEPAVRIEKFNNDKNSNVGTEKKKKNIKRKTVESLDKNHADSSQSRVIINSSLSTENDPYAFETDSLSESNYHEQRDESLSEYDSDSAASSKSGSLERSNEMKKKPRRKRRAWQSGVIVPKHRKKRNQPLPSKSINSPTESFIDKKTIVDPNCFTDKFYCFVKNIVTYDCRLCDYNGSDIVHHYKKEHPHVEIPLSRMSPDIAKEAIKQCDKINLQSISKLPSDRYICRFCFKKFSNQNNLLESFFWHIVSDHTGEYKQKCPVCVDDAQCPLDLDVPPPPKAQKGQIIGYICGFCNYTQVSYENLKNHVVTRHNDEQTEVFIINMSHMSTKAVNVLLKRLQSLSNNIDHEDRRVLRRTRSNISADVTSERSELGDESDASASASSLQENKEKETPLRSHSKIAFENDSDTDKSTRHTESIRVKIEPQSYSEDIELESEPISNLGGLLAPSTVENIDNIAETVFEADIFGLPHFKVNFTETGSKEYVCCINNNNHYKSNLLISFKKHVQMKHSEKWDGYCCLCKVIVTPQGQHSFFNCLQHFLEKHPDNFPVLQNAVARNSEIALPSQVVGDSEVRTPKPFLSVRPLSELISTAVDENLPSNPSPLPIIESVMSLGTPELSPITYPSTVITQPEEKQYLYEEAQADIMSKKNKIVLDAMMSHEKLANVFKCAGRFCSFTTDIAGDALLHASTHSRVGGENALKCAYCDFDSSDNAIDLVTHVFKIHGYCQYACGLCFYRAAASQLVSAHINRRHADAKTKTILKSSFATAESSEATILSRTDAVPYYICNYEGDKGQTCKFKTYILRKFCEHLKSKHGTATVHKCFICQETFNAINVFIQHLKTHGLKLYQCVWCVFGADNENELLDHASSKHPYKQPQAYLRVITNKEGTSEFRVLPLAHLNKSNIPYVDICPSAKENPVREAERSVDLEKLIGHTTLFIDSMAASTSAVTETSAVTDPSTAIPPSQSPQSLEPRAVTPVVPIKAEQRTTPIIKEEQPQTPTKSLPNTSDIISLDSDDDDVICSTTADQEKPSTSTNITSGEPKKLPQQLLFTCPKCKTISKNKNLFKSHLCSCYPTNTNDIPCAYCSFTGTKQKILTHYSSIHLLKSVKFLCSICSETFPTLIQTKEHQQRVHGMTSYEIALKYVNGQRFLTFNDAPKSTSRPKRSVGSHEKSEEPAAKIKKFGLLEIDQLPINPIFDYSVNCSLCEFSTKVRLNMVRHLQMHATKQLVPQTAPVNPVPHLETHEKHFDKMVNLASSSLTVRAQDKPKNDNPFVAVLLPAEDSARYPKYVPERQRLTCGAKGCSYISVDENMLKYHWETLHSGSNDFHCVHCPPNQTLDTSAAVTASRIIGHLKMHDVRLYACSQCSYYHYRRQVVEKHLSEIHQGGNVMIVREELTNPPLSAAPVVPAPTMDLKPWQCGLCEYKSLLRPEVIEHCSTNHQSKMQFKCAYCAFRTSNSDNVIKHQSLSHQGKPEELFYYFYREGSIPNPAGMPLWQAQKIKFNLPDTSVKTEGAETTTVTSQDKSSPPSVDLNIVKQEIPDPVEDTIEDLCKQFGEFCEPNGLKFKCSLCKNVIEDTKEAMQSHLYEELKYRKWGCSICLYRAFHKRGLSEHMQVEHCQNRDPVELEVDVKVETWVSMLLEHQESIIEKNKEKLSQQKAEIDKQPPSTSQVSSEPAQAPSPQPVQKTAEGQEKPNIEELEKKFGSFGSAMNTSYCCPKCNMEILEESAMRDHLESELNRIRWCCSACPQTFQSYHQAQFHCKTHAGMSARPVEAPRDSTLRSAWVNAVLESQKLTINREPMPTQSVETDKQDNQITVPENSLLVVRYEERIPTPEVGTPTRQDHNSEDERLVIDESLKSRKRKAQVQRTCPYCTFTAKETILKSHILRHYGLAPKTCAYCTLTGCRRTILNHQKIHHPDQAIKVLDTDIPDEDPSSWSATRVKTPTRDSNTLRICLICQASVDADLIDSHTHPGFETEFGKIGDVVVKCSTCSSLFKDTPDFLSHDKARHKSLGNYVYFKLVQHTRHGLKFSCQLCPQRFSLKKDWTDHILYMHTQFKNTLAAQPKEVIVLDDDDVQEVSPSPRKVARKSTTKLPNSRAVARKSTTKPQTSYQEEYSFYGTKPCTDNLENITTFMPFYNTLVPFSYKRLTEVLNINPSVAVGKLSLAQFE